MELRHLQYFLAVCEAGNVTRAARQCFVAQSALSAQIARLEAEVGSVLFVRKSRGVQLTPAGRVLRPLAQRILADVEDTRAQMAAFQGVLTGHLRLGTVQGPPTGLDCVDVMGVFHSHYPGVELSLRTGASDDLAAQVAAGSLDLAVIARVDDLPTGLVLDRQVDDPLMAVYAADLPRGEEHISTAELVRMGPFIAYRAGSGLRYSVEAAFARADVSVKVHFEVDQLSDMMRLAGAGVGVTLLPAKVLTVESIAAAGVRITPLVDGRAVHTVGVVFPLAPSPAAQAFTRLLEEYHPQR